MADNQAKYGEIKLYPTLILGLGGTGAKVAVQLKALLEDQFGSGSDYQDIIKFLCFDTATESFRARQPNHPDREEELIPQIEMIRISNVPLHDLMQNKQDYPSIAAILPDVLQSTQIDQGAQQVRRLGRISLFYNYRDYVKGALKQALDSLRDLENKKKQRLSEDKTKRLIVEDTKRLRVFIVSSICGGTGGGTFLDMAYLVRDLAKKNNIDPRSCDVIGMLFLPEAFPEVVTTGEARIRANAYAALLDLEYYNQATGAEVNLFQANMPGGDEIKGESSPFSICYLIERNNEEGALKGMDDLAPMLAEALHMMVASRVGEQLTATIDNIRAWLTNYQHGYRLFYSALGMSQIVFPRLWLRQQFALRFKQKFLDAHILREVNNHAGIKKDVSDWYKAHDPFPGLSVNPDALEEVTRELDHLKEANYAVRDPILAFQAAYRQASTSFQENVIGALEDAIETQSRKFASNLTDKVYASIDNALIEPESENGKGLKWTLQWLQDLRDHVSSALQKLETDRDTFDINAIFSEKLTEISQWGNRLVVGRTVARRRISRDASEIKDLIQGRCYEIASHTALREVLTRLLQLISEQERPIKQAITHWESESRRTFREYDESKRPQFTTVKQSVFTPEESEAFLNKAIRESFETAKVGLFHDWPQSELAKLELDRFSNTLNPEYWQPISQTISHQCLKLYEDYETANKDSVAKHIEAQEQKNPDAYRAMLTSLKAHAQPYLKYKPEMVLESSLSQIKVLGVNDRETSKKFIPMLGGQKDLSIVETNDPTVMSFLVTYHGIPASALLNFEGYGLDYQRLRAKNPASIYHLDEERENAPYDPGSAHFFNLNEFESFFARALAYGWIMRVKNTREVVGNKPFLFILQPEFYQKLHEIVNEEIGFLESAIGDCEASLGDEASKQDVDVFDSIQTATLKRDLKTLRGQLQELTDCLRNLIAVNADGFSNEFEGEELLPDYADTVPPHVLARKPQLITGSKATSNGRVEPLYAVDLRTAFHILFAFPSREPPHLFVRTFNKLLAEKLKSPDGRSLKVRSFLEARLFKAQGDDDEVNPELDLFMQTCRKIFRFTPDMEDARSFWDKWKPFATSDVPSARFDRLFRDTFGVAPDQDKVNDFINVWRAERLRPRASRQDGWWTETTDPDRALEQHLCALLSVFNHLEYRKKYAERLPAGYWSTPYNAKKSET